MLSALGLPKATSTATRALAHFVAPCSSVGLDDEQTVTWLHVAPEGEWNGHRAGPLKLDKTAFAECIASLARRETPPQVDFGHGSLFEQDGLPKPKAGNVRALSLGTLCATAAEARALSSNVFPMPKGGGFLALMPPDSEATDLWAKVEFNEPAAKMVRAKQYEFCSGVFVRGMPDAKTGEPKPYEIDSIALTNRPFIDGQVPIALSAGVTMNIKKADLQAKIDALVEGDTVTAEQLMALVQFLKDSEAKPEAPEVEEVELAAKPADAAACATPPPPAPMADVPPPAAVAVDVVDDSSAIVLTKLAEITGLDNAAILAALDANADQIKAAFLGAGGGAAPMSAPLHALSQTISSLSAELRTFKERDKLAAEKALEGEVDALVTAGKVLPLAKAGWLAIAKSNPTEFRALSAGLPVVVPVGREAAKIEGPPTNSLSETGANADTVPTTDPRYVAAHAHLKKQGWLKALNSIPADKRPAAEEKFVRETLKRAAGISG